MIVRNRCLHLATGRTRDDIKKRIWQRRRRGEKARNGRERVTKKAGVVKSRHGWTMTATAGSDVVQSGLLIFDDFVKHLWPYIGNNTANVVFQMVKRLWLIRIDQ
ncbi:hypothetical protein TNCV_713081 [Trichonephila clavipes]|nr:hypothetical protein TNCV_713081 [Trichonephila clavipes]